MCKKIEVIFPGKEKKIFSTDDNDRVIIHFNDVITAYGGIKRAIIKDKGKFSNRISALLFDELNRNGIPTHFIKQIDEREQLCRRIEIIPLQIIVRNRIAGSTAELLGVEDGIRIDNVVYELRYNNDEIGDPMINSHHAVAIGLVTYEEAEYIHSLAEKVNTILKRLFEKAGIELVDFKMEVGRASDGSLIVSDELSPDNCRLWDIKTGERLDKDRFRHDLSDVRISYMEVMNRLDKLEQK